MITRLDTSLWRRNEKVKPTDLLCIYTHHTNNQTSFFAPPDTISYLFFVSSRASMHAIEGICCLPCSGSGRDQLFLRRMSLAGFCM